MMRDMIKKYQVERRKFLQLAGLGLALIILARGAAAANRSRDDKIGEIDPHKVSIKDVGENFDFVVFADPQGGDPNDATNDAPERVAIHNPFIIKNIDLVNQLSPRPEFLIVAGDIVDSKGQKSNYQVMLRLLGKLKMPVLFALGNHETPYGSSFAPPHNDDALQNYLDAQRQINGLGKIAYSFNVGRWHFIIWPDPLRRDFWQAHPHYFDWLEQDLKEHKDRPTMLFQHISLLPIGISPMINYSEKPHIKRRLLDIITRHGNVRYVISGHTHITSRASFKIARTYRGATFINLPAAGYRARGFGEPDFEDGPSQGFAVVSIRGDKAKVQFRRVTGQILTYPEEFPEFKPERYFLWLNEEWELPTNATIINGGFENGLRGWQKRFVYREDEDPSSICQAVNGVSHSPSRSLYMFCRERGAAKLGQDRLPQTINRISQAICIEQGKIPVLKAWYRLDGRDLIADRESGAYVAIRGYRGSRKRLNTAYWIGKGLRNPSGLYGPRSPYLHFDVTSSPEKWHKVIMNLKGDWDASDKKPKFDKLNLDRLVVTLGVWTDNIGTDNRTGIYFDDIEICFEPEGTDIQSSLDGRAIRQKPKYEMWGKRMVHINGEHAYRDIE
ncbi:MAG: metallophosphoesterase [Phycisphaerales bacterium]|nr:MAG: metallophosphoesterase [Phycisphaerales bacterium]